MRGSNEGDKQGASSATSPSPLTSRPLFLALYLFLSRVLESGRILTRRGSYSSLDPVHSVALSSRPRPSSSPHLRTSFSRKGEPVPNDDDEDEDAIAFGHPFLAPGALFHPPFSPFSLVSHFCLGYRLPCALLFSLTLFAHLHSHPPSLSRSLSP